MLHTLFSILAASGPVPSLANLVLTCAFYALIGYALALLRWWAGIPFLVFLAITLAASFKRIDDLRARGPLAPAFTSQYLVYHGIAAVLAAAIILYGMRTERLSRRAPAPA